MKERVTLTIEREILEKIDQKIDGSIIKNRSHAVELLLLKAFSSNRPRKAVILAGGDNPERTLIEIKGKSILVWNVELLKRHGVKKIMLCIQKNSKIKDVIGDGKNFDIEIYYNEENLPLGTAGSIRSVSNFINETTIICNGDELKNIDLDDMYEFHKDGNKMCTIALTTVNNPERFGVALLNGNKIVAFVEKPLREDTLSKLVNAGLYIVEPEIIKYIPDGFSKIENDVFPRLAKEENLWGYVFSGQWFSTKTAESVTRAINEWKGI